MGTAASEPPQNGDCRVHIGQCGAVVQHRFALTEECRRKQRQRAVFRALHGELAAKAIAAAHQNRFLPGIARMFQFIFFHIHTPYSVRRQKARLWIRS